MQVLHHLLSKILLVTMRNTHREIEKPKKKKNTQYHSLLCLLPLQRNLHLLSATVGLLSLPSADVNLHIISKTFALKHPRIAKSEFETHPDI